MGKVSVSLSPGHSNNSFQCIEHSSFYFDLGLEDVESSHKWRYNSCRCSFGSLKCGGVRVWAQVPMNRSRERERSGPTPSLGKNRVSWSVVRVRKWNHNVDVGWGCVVVATRTWMTRQDPYQSHRLDPRWIYTETRNGTPSLSRK